jgi:hypothetical protein
MSRRISLAINPVSGVEVQAMVDKPYQTPEPLARTTREILGTQ